MDPGSQRSPATADSANTSAPHGHAAGDVEERGVATFVGSHVVGRETYTVRATVIVNSEIGQPLVSGPKNAALDEFGPQHAVPALAANIVPTVGCQVQFPCDKPKPAIRPAGARQDDGAVFVAISRKEMIV